MIQTYIANTFDELSKILKESYGAGLWFRGQVNETYALQTRIADKFRDSLITKIKFSEIINRFKTLLFQKNLLHKLLLPNEYKYKAEYFIIFQAQHLGVPTIFMDWSREWEKALYFAVHPEKYIDVPGQFMDYASYLV